MKMSAIMFIPRNIQKSVTKYRIAKNGRLIVDKPGKRIPLKEQISVSMSILMAKPF